MEGGENVAKEEEKNKGERWRLHGFAFTPFSVVCACSCACVCVSEVSDLKLDWQWPPTEHSEPETRFSSSFQQASWQPDPALAYITDLEPAPPEHTSRILFQPRELNWSQINKGSILPTAKNRWFQLHSIKLNMQYVAVHIMLMFLFFSEDEWEFFRLHDTFHDNLHTPT